MTALENRPRVAGLAASGLTAPGPSLPALVASLPRLWQDPVAWLMSAWQRYGDVVRLGGGPFGPVHLVVDPADVALVLQGEHGNFPKHVFFDLFRSGLGDGLLSSQGERWKQQRRLVQPLFNPAAMDRWGDVVASSTQSYCERWEAVADRRGRIDLLPELAALTRGTICRIIFGHSMGEVVEEGRRAFFAAAPWSVVFGDRPFGPRRRFNQARAALDARIMPLIRERRRRLDTARDSAQTTRDSDLLTQLILARDPMTGATMSDEEIRTMCLTLVFTGYDTLTAVLAWTLLLLADHSSIDEQLVLELKSVPDHRPMTAADLDQLPLLDRVCHEVMRLNPPAWAAARRVVSEAELGGYRIPAGSLVMVSSHLTHRHPSVWDEAERFDPDRFLPERLPSPPAGAYFPFGMGPRQCIGRHLALFELKLMLAVILPRLSWRRTGEGPVLADSRVVVRRPRSGTRMWVRRRSVD